jgi:hypothetical protein
LALKPPAGEAASVLFISASATEIDETFLVNGTADLYSALWSFDTASGYAAAELLLQQRHLQFCAARHHWHGRRT